LIYIAMGNAHLHGFHRFNEAWKRVHHANMQKELSHEGNPGKYGKLGDKRDIVKPPGWTPPDHSDLVANSESRKVPIPEPKLVLDPIQCPHCQSTFIEFVEICPVCHVKIAIAPK
jgi:hypothetical protein